MREFVLKSILGGILISLGGFVYLASGMTIIGAVLFAFGLITVILSGANLFTGKSGFCNSLEDYVRLIWILLLNVVGCFMMGYVAKHMDVSTIIEARLRKGLVDILLLSVCTGMIMTIAVNYGKRKEMLPLLFGVPLFITCGMPHCIADAFYYSIYYWQTYSLSLGLLCVWVVSIIGNFIGCILPTKLFKIWKVKRTIR